MELEGIRGNGRSFVHTVDDTSGLFVGGMLACRRLEIPLEPLPCEHTPFHALINNLSGYARVIGEFRVPLEIQVEELPHLDIVIVPSELNVPTANEWPVGLTSKIRLGAILSHGLHGVRCLMPRRSEHVSDP